MSAVLSATPDDSQATVGRFLKITDVVRETSLSRATIYRLIAAGSFPTPFRITRQRVAWSDGAVQRWKNDQAASAQQ